MGSPALNAAVQRITRSSVGEGLGRAVNLAIPFLVLQQAEPGERSDLFFLALAIAFFLHGTVSNALITVLVPQMVAGARLPSRILGWSSAGMALLGAITCFFLALPAVEARDALILAAAVAVSALSGLLVAPAVAALHLRHRYFLTGFSWSFRAIPLAVFVLTRDIGLPALLLGIAAADVARAALLLYFANDDLGRDRPTSLPAVPLGSNATNLIVSALLAGGAPLAARTIAAWSGDGNLSALEAADRVYSALVSLATLGLSNVALVYFSRASAGEQVLSWRRMAGAGFAFGLFWALLVAAIVSFLPLFEKLLPAGSAVLVQETRRAFLALSIGMPAFVAIVVLSKQIVVRGRSSALPPLALMGLAVTSVAALWLGPAAGAAGVALAMSGGQYTVLVLMLIVMIQSEKENAHPRS